MAILTPPSFTRFARSGFRPLTRSIRFPGAVQAGGQTLVTPTGLWAGDFTLPRQSLRDPLTRAWKAFLTDLDGSGGRFYMGDPDGQTPQGTPTGAPVVDGAGQSGTSLLITGATALVSGWLLLADYFHVDMPSGRRELKMIRGADIDTDGTGAASLTFKPPLRESPGDGAAIVTVNPTCVMQLLDDQQAGWEGNEVGAAAIAFRAVEAVDIF